jgi:hypothetical protein
MSRKTINRKTINVEVLRTIANKELSYTGRYTCPEQREGVVSMIEAVLSISGNYKGFRYLDVNEVSKDDLPGIRVLEDNEFTFDNCDNTRRHYF